MALRAVMPTILGRDWWSTWDYPERIPDQCFGMQLYDEDLLPRTRYRGFTIHPRTQTAIANSGLSEIKNDDKKFQVALNVKQFKPEEIEVKIVDSYIVVHGKHEEKNDDDGSFTAREFTRRYMLPQACEGDAVTSSLNPEGILTIVAPKKAIEVPKQERKVPVSVDEPKAEAEESK